MCATASSSPGSTLTTSALSTGWGSTFAISGTCGRRLSVKSFTTWSKSPLTTASAWAWMCWRALLSSMGSILGLMALQLTLACWAVLELGVRGRELSQGRGGAARDRGTRVLIVVTLAPAIAVAAGSAGPPRAAGVIVIWLGLAIRVWAIAALGRRFRTTVEVDPGQAIVTSGPYRWVRHPSYTGLLMLVAGYGLASGTWLGLVVCLVLPPAAVSRRIAGEGGGLGRLL